VNGRVRHREALCGTEEAPHVAKEAPHVRKEPPRAAEHGTSGCAVVDGFLK